MNEKVRVFCVRTASATVYAALFLGAIFCGHIFGSPVLGGIVLTTFALFVALGCTFEYYRIAQMQGFRPNKVLGYVCVTLVVSGLGLAPAVSAYDSEEAIFVMVAMMTLLAAVVCFLAVPSALVAELWRQSDHPFADAMQTLLPVVYCAVPLGFMPYLNTEGIDIMCMCVVLVWVNDSFAYMGGSLFGKHKMWSRHSPGKTWEGGFTGLLGCLLVAYFVGPVLSMHSSCVLWLILGVVCSVAGTLGDYVESMLKRSVGIKDSGNIMPGHGGFLDRFDSLLMIIPFAVLISFFIGLF